MIKLVIRILPHYISCEVFESKVLGYKVESEAWATTVRLVCSLEASLSLATLQGVSNQMKCTVVL